MDNILDKTVLDQLYLLGQGTGVLVCGVIDAFQRSIPGYMEDLRQGVVNNDANEVRMASHAMKSSAANLGATEFAAQCQIMEHHSRDGDLSNSKEDLAVIEKLLESLKIALDNEYQKATSRKAA